MSPNPRRKGNRRELELVQLLPGAVKVSRAGYTGPDLEWRDRQIEVKARADGFRELYKWLRNAQLLAVKADRQPWLIVVDLDTFLDLLDEVDLPPHVGNLE